MMAIGRRVDLEVQVARTDARLEEVVGESSAIFFVSVVTRTRSASSRWRISFKEVVDLVARRPELDLGVDDPRRADELFGDDLGAREQAAPGC